MAAPKASQTSTAHPKTDKPNILLDGDSATIAKTDAIHNKWQSQVKAAKSNWNKISAAELLKSNGTEVNLTELVQHRYALSKNDANKQVKIFIANCH